jgi:hypothetical protein
MEHVATTVARTPMDFISVAACAAVKVVLAAIAKARSRCLCCKMAPRSHRICAQIYDGIKWAPAQACGNTYFHRPDGEGQQAAY